MRNRLFESIQQPAYEDNMTSLISKTTIEALNPSYWDQFGGINKSLLDQVDQLKAELRRAQEGIVSLEIHNKELCESNMAQKATIQQLTTSNANLEAQIQQLSQNNASQEAKIQEMSENTASQNTEIQELSAYLKMETGENKTLWQQVIYLTRELETSKKSTTDWKDLYHRERELHADNKQQKMDLENQLNARTQELREELNLRREMTANEKRMKIEFNELREKYDEIAEDMETVLGEQQQRQSHNEMWSLQQSVSEQTELIKSLLAEQHHMNNTIVHMTKASAETERSFQREIQELKNELRVQSSPAEDDIVQPDIVQLTEHIESLNQELEKMQFWAEEQSDLLNKRNALYRIERGRRRRLYRQLKKARKQLQNEPKMDTPNKLESTPQNSFTETHPGKTPTSGCKQEKQIKTAQKQNKKRRQRMNKEPSK